MRKHPIFGSLFEKAKTDCNGTVYIRFYFEKNPCPWAESQGEYENGEGHDEVNVSTYFRKNFIEQYQRFIETGINPDWPYA